MDKLSYSLSIKKLEITHHGSFQNVVKSARLFIKATNSVGKSEEVFWVVHFDLNKITEDNFVEFSKIQNNKQIVEKWIWENLEGTNLENIKKDFYNKFFPTTWEINPGWDVETTETQPDTSHLIQDQIALPLEGGKPPDWVAY
jgi:hypothetical protein